MNQLWYGNQPLVSDSPFVVAYRDDVYNAKQHSEGLKSIIG